MERKPSTVRRRSREASLSNTIRERAPSKSNNNYDQHDDTSSQKSSATQHLTEKEPKQKKKSFSERFKASLPTFTQCCKTLKATIALFIAVVMALDYHTRAVIGPAVLLTAIVTIFYFPVRPIGMEIEAVLFGTFGALVGAAWCFLGSFLANLARDPADPSPIQAPSSVILAVFLFLGIFAVNYVRMRMPKANFACVHACILMIFSFTQASVESGFNPEAVWAFLRPIALAGALALSVNIFLWPDDSVSNYMAVLRRTLLGYDTFFKEHSDAFLSLEPTSITLSLPSLHACLQGSVLVLIDCKRAVQRDVLYSYMSSKDISDLTKLVKHMRNPLHGIGLSVIQKKAYLDIKEPSPYLMQGKEEDQDAFLEVLGDIKPVCQELSDAAQAALTECIDRLDKYSRSPRSNLNSLLWPFPRIFFPRKEKNEDKEREKGTTTNALKRLRAALDRFNALPSSAFKRFCGVEHDENIPSYGPLYLLFLYQFNLKEHALQVKSLLKFMEQTDQKRQHRRIWFPRMSVKKWFRSNDVDPNLGGDNDDYGQQGMGGTDLTLVRTLTRNNTDLEDHRHSMHPIVGGKYYKRDPDVDPPVTPVERFFYGLHLVCAWFMETNTFFAFKTAVAVVLFAIPAFYAPSASWFFNWRGQWAMITMVLWMFPMTGMFFFAIMMRVAGTILGGVLGIVVWEISRGNPYGLAVVLFIFILPLYYAFFFIAPLRVLALMAKVTMLLVCIYEYNYVVDQLPNHDEVYTVAGKRMLLVIIGVAASAILSMIPFPVIGRVELRKRLARTLRDIGQLYTVLVAHMVRKQPATEDERRAFRKLALDIRRQISDERNFLQHASFEPPLRGRFPAASYAVLVEKVDNMADLVHNMGFAARTIDPSWQRKIASVLTRERKDYLASIVTTIKLVSSTMTAKASLPPYMISPQEARQRYIKVLEERIEIGADEIGNPTFPSYSTFIVNSSTFVSELQIVLDTVEGLVGVEDPTRWLLMNV
ncbi:uncharacterized protein BYT42DRAFT_557576 [Radiomyces spectabilis]|uniref:uncharacterized protein n=1 Tax=Radiomyces spectabilis TaxID=64574 RepID=UPI0022209F04|nr:uncharacterized protein BYT42DRAFT_557576 [Radiomyces spectabilis]KAI8391640.1 hypothetical protein BYT42DRAFT_557576 [Radiomyces spectabilis]